MERIEALRRALGSYADVFVSRKNAGALLRVGEDTQFRCGGYRSTSTAKDLRPESVFIADMSDGTAEVDLRFSSTERLSEAKEIVFYARREDSPVLLLSFTVEEEDAVRRADVVCPLERFSVQNGDGGAFLQLQVGAPRILSSIDGLLGEDGVNLRKYAEDCLGRQYAKALLTKDGAIVHDLGRAPSTVLVSSGPAGNVSESTSHGFTELEIRRSLLLDDGIDGRLSRIHYGGPTLKEILQGAASLYVSVVPPSGTQLLVMEFGISAVSFGPRTVDDGGLVTQVALLSLTIPQ